MAVTGKRKYEREAFESSLKFVRAGLEIHPAEARLAPGIAGKRRALFVVHGMGQQLPFETLDAVANGLYREDIALHGSAGAPLARAAHVQLGDERLERVEMRLRRSANDYQDVDLYEAYWAPLTEGAVTLRDVMRFLCTAGFNGVKNAGGVFQRWMFGALRDMQIPVRSLLFLLVALGVVLSLVVINAAIIAIPAARSPFQEPPDWLSDALFQDLTDLFNATVVVVELFAASIVASLLVSHARAESRWFPWLRRLLARVLAGLSLGLFALAIFAIVATGAAIPMLVGLHVYGTSTSTLLPDWIRRFGASTPTLTVLLGSVVAAGIIGYLTKSILLGYWRQLADAWRHSRRQPPSPGPTSSSVVADAGASVNHESWKGVAFSSIVLGGFSGLLYGVWRLAAALVDASGIDGGDNHNAWWAVLTASPVWATLVVLGVVVRSFLVQYAGDVAAYVQPHTVDRFNELRNKIKDTVRKTAEAVYAQKSNGKDFDYDEIVVVGHSLGSVIAYDTLNRLLLDDTASTSGGRPYGVAGRTTILLTFGSPLDKTAFVFTTQSKRASMTHVRESLAAEVQPLIEDRVVRQRIAWVNVYSPWDIISGRLDFYDDPDGKTPAVRNQRDPEAVTLLGAHTEYWRNWLVFERLHETLTR